MIIDPNLVYLVLVAALWLIAAAIYLPGTGIIELLALAGCVGAALAMIAMPTNWGAVVLVVLGVLMFLVLPFINTRLAWLALIGLVVQAVASVALFNGLTVSLPLIGFTTGAALLYHRFALLPAMARQTAQPAMLDDQSMIGAQGYVQRALNPVGTVYVRGETWTARSSEPIEAGTPIVVTERDGLTLFVEPDKQKRETVEME
jgi:membrane-bound serine protease (ClpP class)